MREDEVPSDLLSRLIEDPPQGASSMWNLVTRVGAIDLAFEPSGTHGYADLRRAAIQIELGDATITVASLADVIRSKEAAGREKDRLALPRLRRLLERIDTSR